MHNECPYCKDRDFPVASDRDLQASVFSTQWTTETVLREKRNKEGEKEKVSVKITVKKKTDNFTRQTTLQNLLELTSTHTVRISLKFLGKIQTSSASGAVSNMMVMAS